MTQELSFPLRKLKHFYCTVNADILFLDFGYFITPESYLALPSITNNLKSWVKQSLNAMLSFWGAHHSTTPLQDTWAK